MPTCGSGAAVGRSPGASDATAAAPAASPAINIGTTDVRELAARPAPASAAGGCGPSALSASARARRARASTRRRSRAAGSRRSPANGPPPPGEPECSATFAIGQPSPRRGYRIAVASASDTVGGRAHGRLRAASEVEELAQEALTLLLAVVRLAAALLARV